ATRAEGAFRAAQDGLRRADRRMVAGTLARMGRGAALAGAPGRCRPVRSGTDPGGLGGTSRRRRESAVSALGHPDVRGLARALGAGSGGVTRTVMFVVTE